MILWCRREPRRTNLSARACACQRTQWKKGEKPRSVGRRTLGVQSPRASLRPFFHLHPPAIDDNRVEREGGSIVPSTLSDHTSEESGK
jgi:hypothetical protein